MTILSVCQQLSSVIGIDRPQSVVGSAEREHQELVDLATEMAQRIAQAYPWSILRRSLTLTKGSSVYDLPGDFDYFAEGVQLRIANGCLEHVTDTDRWLQIEVKAFRYGHGAWIRTGSQIQFDRTMTQDVRSFYQSALWIIHNGGPYDAIVDNEDRFRLDERLLFLGMLWQWKAYKGLPYAEDMASFEEHLAWLVLRDKGSRTFTIGRRRWQDAGNVFYGNVGNPGTGGGTNPVDPVDPVGPVDPVDPVIPTPGTGFPYTLPFALA